MQGRNPHPPVSCAFIGLSLGGLCELLLGGPAASFLGDKPGQVLGRDLRRVGSRIHRDNKHFIY